jgi:hypothetical protein
MSAGASKPQNMRDLPQSVCWRAERRKDKTTKIPYSPASGSHASCDDPTAWGTFVEARKTSRGRTIPQRASPRTWVRVLGDLTRITCVKPLVAECYRPSC